MSEMAEAVIDRAEVGRRRLSVVDTADCKLHFVDAETREIIRTLDAPPMPHEVLLDESSRLAYVAVSYKDGFVGNYEEANYLILVVDVDAMEIVGEIDVSPHYGPHAMALSPDSTILYVTCESEGGCVVSVDVKTHAVVGHAPVDATAPHWMAVLSDGGKAYTANKETPYITVSDLESSQLLKRIPAEHGTEGIAVSPDDRLVYVTSQRSPELYVIDTTTDEIAHVVELPEPAGMVAVTPDGSKVLLTYFNFEYWTGGKPEQSYFQIMDAASRELGERIPTGRFPLNIVTDRDSTTAYVTCYFTGSLFVIDLASGTAEESPAGKGPHGLVVVDPPATAL